MLSVVAKIMLRQSPPVDSSYLCYGILLFEGIGNLFPWNAFITAFPYFATRFCGTYFSDNFESYFAFAYNLSQTFGLLFSVFFQKRLTPQSMIVWPLIIYFFVFFLTTATVAIDFESNLVFWATLVSTSLCGLCGALQSGGLFALAAKFPSTYTNAIMNGQGLAGLIVAVSSIITILAAKQSAFCDTADESTEGSCDEFYVDKSALAYFSIGSALIFACIGAFLLLQRLQFARYYICDEYDNEKKGTFSGGGGHEELDERDQERLSERLLRCDDFEINGPSTSGAVSISSGGESGSHSSVPHWGPTVWRVANLVKVPAVSVCLTFTVTLAIYPALVVLLESHDHCTSKQRFYNDLFVPFQFLLYALCDFCGRVSAGALPIFRSTNIWIPAVGRILFFPLFLLCKVKGTQLPVAFENDFFPLFFVAAFGLSNGHVASASMMLGPPLVPPEDSPLAGTLMVLALTLGCLFGACVSFLTVFISQGPRG